MNSISWTTGTSKPKSYANVSLPVEASTTYILYTIVPILLWQWSRSCLIVFRSDFLPIQNFLPPKKFPCSNHLKVVLASSRLSPILFRNTLLTMQLSLPNDNIWSAGEMNGVKLLPLQDCHGRGGVGQTSYFIGFCLFSLSNAVPLATRL